MDARIEIDRILSEYYKGHKDVEYCDLHDEYAVVYLFRKQLFWSYDSESDVEETVNRIKKEVDRMVYDFYNQYDDYSGDELE